MAEKRSGGQERKFECPLFKGLCRPDCVFRSEGVWRKCLLADLARTLVEKEAKGSLGS